MNFIKGFKKSLKKNTKKQDSEFKEKEHKENKFLSDVLENTDVRPLGKTKQSRKYRHNTVGNNKNNPENTDIRLLGTIKTIEDLETNSVKR